MTPQRGHPPGWWEKENRRLIEVRLKLGLPLLPWMGLWLYKRNLTIEGEGKKRQIKRRST